MSRRIVSESWDSLAVEEINPSIKGAKNGVKIGEGTLEMFNNCSTESFRKHGAKSKRPAFVSVGSQHPAKAAICCRISS